MQKDTGLRLYFEELIRPSNLAQLRDLRLVEEESCEKFIIECCVVYMCVRECMYVLCVRDMHIQRCRHAPQHTHKQIWLSSVRTLLSSFLFFGFESTQLARLVQKERIQMEVQ